MNRGSRRPSRGLFVSLLTLIALTSWPSSAGAGTLVDTATDCNRYLLEQPFLRFGDPFAYVLAPNGTFERAARGWTLTGGARVVPGNESFYVHRRGERRSLQLRAGSSATSPSMCVGIEYPTLRTFALNRRSSLSTLAVEVLFEDAAGAVHALPIGFLTASNEWGPTIPLPVVANLLPLLPDNRTAVAFRFSPQDAAGDWRIDDVYVDPYRSR